MRPPPLPPRVISRQDEQRGQRFHTLSPKPLPPAGGAGRGDARYSPRVAAMIAAAPACQPARVVPGAEAGRDLLLDDPVRGRRRAARPRPSRPRCGPSSSTTKSTTPLSSFARPAGRLRGARGRSPRATARAASSGTSPPGPGSRSARRTAQALLEARSASAAGFRPRRSTKVRTRRRRLRRPPAPPPGPACPARAADPARRVITSAYRRRRRGRPGSRPAPETGRSRSSRSAPTQTSTEPEVGLSPGSPSVPRPARWEALPRDLVPCAASL